MQQTIGVSYSTIYPVRALKRVRLRAPQATQNCSHVQTTERQTVLCTKFKAHDASLTAAIVYSDAPGEECHKRSRACRMPALRSLFVETLFLILVCIAIGHKEVVTASLDKTLARWVVEGVSSVRVM